MSKGLKRICMSCGMRFYDLDKRPIICPSCNAEFTGEEKVKTRRGRVAVVAEDKPVKKLAAIAGNSDDEDDIEDIDADEDIVSLDDVDEDDDLDDDEDALGIDEDELDDGLDDLDDVDDLDEEDDEDEDEDEQKS